MARIISGVYRGRELKVPQRGTRPTASMVKEAMFSRLEGWNLLRDSRVLDLCAGSGALGFEALSRGARRADFVEAARAAVIALRANQKTLGAVAAVIHQQKVEQFLAGSPHACDVVFLDPPYEMSNEQIAIILESLSHGWLEKHAVVVVERAKHSAELILPEKLQLMDRKNYGDTAVHYLELKIEV